MTKLTADQLLLPRPLNLFHHIMQEIVGVEVEHLDRVAQLHQEGMTELARTQVKNGWTNEEMFVILVYVALLVWGDLDEST